MMADTQHFCLRWNNYQSSITSAFENLRDDEDFVDVTLACEGKSLKAHRVVLSACSPYFRELLKSTPCKHPVIVLQDVAFADLYALVEFIYHGEVNVHQRNLSSFLKTAEVLRVSGLTQQADDRDECSSQTPGLLRGGNMQYSFTEKLVEDALFTSPPSPPIGTSGGATVQQLLRRAAAAAAVASTNRRERHNSSEQQSDSSEQSQHAAPSKRPRTTTTTTTTTTSSSSLGLETNSHNNSETTSALTNQVTPTDFSTSPFPKVSQLTLPSGLNRKADQESSGDRDSSPSPTGGLMDGVKTEPVELLCGNADGDNSNDSVEVKTDSAASGGGGSGGGGGGNGGSGGNHQQSQSAEDQQDHDSVPGHLGSAYISTPESKLFGSVTSGGSFNFSMAALSGDHANLSGITNASLQSSTDGSPGTSSQGFEAMIPAFDGSAVNTEFSPKVTCLVCGKMLSSKGSLRRHINDKHSCPGVFRCPLCARSYSTQNSLNKHRYTYHKSDKRVPWHSPDSEYL